MHHNYTYDAFGETESQAGATENSYLFAGEQFDRELGNYYLRDRYYDTETDRFSRMDTYLGQIQSPVSLHKYVYANADPINGIDPSGYSTLTEQTWALRVFGELATKFCTVIENPMAMETAKAWSVLLAAGVGAGYLALQVLRETKNDGTLDVKVVPDDWDNPKNNSRRREPQTGGNRDMNRMRLQIQGDGDFGIGMFNTPEVGVTVLQVSTAAEQLIQLRRSSFDWLSNKHANGALLLGIQYILKQAQSYVPGGVPEGQQQAATYQWDSDDPRGANAIKARGSSRNKSRDYRIDLENNKGRNLRS